MKKITALECRDTALAISFLLLLIWLFTYKTVFIYSAMVFLLWSMIFPSSLAPLAKMWFGLSHLMGLVMSKVILTIIFIAVVLPMALVRRYILKKDSLDLRKWKNGQLSCFKVRDHLYNKDDLTSPF